MRLFIGMLALAGAFAVAPVLAAEAPGADAPAVHTVTAFALHGEPKYGPERTYFDYVNPNAPKGGVVHFSQNGTYDTFNPYIIRGAAAVTILPLTYDTLLAASGDEPATAYALVAKSITYPDDYAWAEFTIDPKARWHDGKPITPEDVVFTVDTFKAKGSPNARGNIEDVVKAEVTGPHKVRFTFNQKGNRGLIINAGRLPILPKHYWQDKDFSAPTITPPLTSGPYKIAAYDLGKSITLERVKDYWGKDLPANVGRYNYGTMVYDFYRSNAVAFEAFKTGKVDIRWENNKNWATAYTWPAYKRGEVKRLKLNIDGGVLLQGFFFNLRKPMFQDIRVREAMAYAFDFTWENKNLFYGMFRRSDSYFGPNDRAAHGMPSAAELKLLEPFRGKVPPRVFTTPPILPDTDGTQEGLRKNLAVAHRLLTEAGYTLKSGKLVSAQGKPLEFEVVLFSPQVEPVTLNWVQNLKLLGINARMRTVDTTQFINRVRQFDFEVAVGWIPQVGTPGTEQRNRWGSKAADQPGSYNWMGIKDPVVDALLDKVISAKDEESYMAALHAVDRVLLWNFYCIPHYNGGNKLLIGYWDRFGIPKTQPKFGLAYTTAWWVDPAKDKALLSEKAREPRLSGSAAAETLEKKRAD
jgi:microcin C transport system substrate-binding protein